MKTKVIHRDNLPNKFPFTLYVIIWLLFKIYNAPDWAYAVVITLFVIALIGFFYRLTKEDDIDIFKEPDPPPQRRSSFEEKLAERMKEKHQQS